MTARAKGDSSRASYLLDTNLIVRLVVGDPPNGPAVADRVVRLFDAAAAGEHGLVATPVVVAESLFVLTSFYRSPRPDAALAVRRVLGLKGVRVREAGAVAAALDLFAARPKLHFVDAYLLSLAAAEGAGLATADAALARAAGREVPVLDPLAAPSD